MATTGRGAQPRRTKVPAAATAAIPTPPAKPSTPMTAAEAAPALDAAHADTVVAAASLLPATAVVPEPVVIPATPSPNPAPLANEEPLSADNAATPAATKDSSMDMNATIENATQTASDSFKNGGGAMFAEVSERTKGAVEKSQKLLAEMAEFNKGTLEAMVESSKIAARGFESMGQDAAAYAKTSFEGTTQTMKTLAAVKSPTEFMKLQADYMRSTFDALVAQTSRSTEASLKLAGEVAQPISNRVALAADKMKIPA